MQTATSCRLSKREGNVSLNEVINPETGRVIEYEILLATSSMRWHAGRLKDAEQIFTRIALEDRRARLRAFLDENKNSTT